MSVETREFANTTITIWYKRMAGIGLGDDVTYDVATTMACYERGGSSQYSDVNGVMFTPQSMYWMESMPENPSLGDFIALGDQSAIPDPTDADDAEVVRIAALQDCSELGDIDDIKVVT